LLRSETEIIYSGHGWRVGSERGRKRGRCNSREAAKFHKDSGLGLGNTRLDQVSLIHEREFINGFNSKGGQAREKGNIVNTRYTITNGSKEEIQ